MITIKTGNIFDSTADVLVNPVNCVGVMGAGLALAFKNKYPDMFAYYHDLCKGHNLFLGYPAIYNGTPRVLLFPTKGHWREKSEMVNIEHGLEFFAKNAENWNVQSVAFPLLGAGLGGLSKNDVLRVMCDRLAVLDIPIEIYKQ